jgi:ferritin-like metal-binding protein YciE
MTTMHDLLLHELSDLYSAEEQIIEALPKMIDRVGNEKLAAALTDHLKATDGHLKRLDKIFKLLGAKPSGEVCTGMKGLLAEGAKLLAKNAQIEPAVLDAAIVGAAQRVEHYEMAGYGCARTYCHLLGETECQTLLQATLNEEGEANRLLTELAISEINAGAQMMQAGG